MKKASMCCTIVILLIAVQTQAADDTVKVFVMAGQSNIAGFAGNSLFDYQATAPETKDFFSHLRDGDKWIIRDDVFIKFGNRKGPLTLGYGASGYTGIEYEFGYVMGEYLKEPVLLIKVAGGSLYQNFRPPSAGLPPKAQLEAELLAQRNRVKADNQKNNQDNPLPVMDDVANGYGGSYREIVAEVENVIGHYETLFPELKGKKPEVAGFVWFQGFSDCSADAAAEYEKNMACFIRDVRKDLNAPKMPFVIAMLGVNGSKKPEGGGLMVQNAQWAMNGVPEFKDNVKAYRTDVFVDKAAEKLFPTWQTSPEWKKVGSHWACHYYGSAIWYTKIGRKGGETMIELIENGRK